MDGSKTMKKYVSARGAALALSLLALPGFASAQQLSHQQIVTTLGRVTNNSTAIDVVVLAQEAEANVGKGVSNLPDYANLSKLSQLIVEINFENNSIAIEPESYRTIGLIADALHHPDLFRYKFLVVGHTSSTGDALHNLKLSQQRADAIRVALATTFAVPADQLFSVGVGQEWPIDPANPKGAINRRVNLINLGIVK
jgi:outer membrane protein OmpA-like peptidoglycan-associated protein